MPNMAGMPGMPSIDRPVDKNPNDEFNVDELVKKIDAKIAELEQRKKTDPVTNYLVAENNGEYILEFIVGDSSDGKMNIVEVDVHYYKQMTINGRNASVLSFYSGRAYGDDIMQFIQSIPQKSAYFLGNLGLSFKLLMPSYQAFLFWGMD